MQSIFFACYMFRNAIGFINGCKVKCEESDFIVLDCDLCPFYTFATFKSAAFFFLLLMKH